MIIDNVKNIGMYKCLGERMAKAIDAIPRLLDAEAGKYSIDGEDIFAMVQEYDTKDRSEAKFEAHRKYIDIQYIVSGTEVMDTCLLKDMETVVPYNPEKDVEFFKAPEALSSSVLSAGDFTIFYPDDVHAPALSLDKSQPVKKILAKILV